MLLTSNPTRAHRAKQGTLGPVFAPRQMQAQRGAVWQPYPRVSAGRQKHSFLCTATLKLNSIALNSQEEDPEQQRCYGEEPVVKSVGKHGKLPQARSCASSQVSNSVQIMVELRCMCWATLLMTNALSFESDLS